MRPLHHWAGALAVLCAFHAAATTLPAFNPLPAFPGTADGAFGVAVDALRDGRFVAYDGQSVLVQQRWRSDQFLPVATGYPGDPGFISASPDGRHVLLGAGFNGELWLLDLQNPVDAAAPIAVLGGNFSAAWLTDDRIVINRATQPDPAVFAFVAELGILDLRTDPPAYDIVVRPAGGASAGIAVGPLGKRVYTTDGLTGDTRYFHTADLLAAADDAVTLDWDDGVLLGTYNSGGPLGVTPDGRLLFIGGADPIEFLGFVQAVDIRSGEVIEEFNPSGNFGTFYGGAITPVTGRVLLVGSSFPGPAIDAYESARGIGASPLPLLWNLIVLQIIQAIQAFLAELAIFRI